MRKKLFAIVMSMTMVASFMPSLAFAAVGHTTHTPNLADNCTWAAVEAVLDGPNADYVKVLEKPTHTKTGKILVTCKETFCDREEELTVQALGHDDEWVAKDLTLEEYGAARLATGTLADEHAVATWLKAQKASGACYVKNVYVCSCGNVEWRASDPSAPSAVVYHNRGDVPACTDATCVKCGVALKGTGHVHAADLQTEDKVEANKIPATCGAKVSYKVKCDTCGKLLAVKADESTTVTGAAHNYGTPVALSEATVLQSNGAYKVKSGYAGIKLGSSGNNAKPGDEISDTTGYNFYKLNKVISEGTCSAGAQLGLVCTVCDNPAQPTTAITATPAVPATVFEVKDAAHDYDVTNVPATCDNRSKTVKVCKVCRHKETVYATTDDRLAHTYKVTKTPATCGTPDSYSIECTTCEKDCDSHKRDFKLADFNLATVENVVDSAAKTTTVYWTGYNGELKGNNKIELVYSTAPVVAHKWGLETVVKEATCTEDAKYGRKCSECGKYDLSTIYDKTGTQLGHDLVKAETAATCGSYGFYTEQCSRCGLYKQTADGRDVVDEHGNVTKTGWTKDIDNAIQTKSANPVVKQGAKCSFDKWVVTKKATVFEEGVKTLTCSVCGAHDATKTVIAKKTVAKASNTVKAGKKSFNVKSSAANATGYRVYYKKAGAKSWKSYTKKTTSLSKTFSGLSKGKYYVKVRAYAKNYDGDGQVVWGATSSTKSVKVK